MSFIKQNVTRDLTMDEPAMSIDWTALAVRIGSVEVGCAFEHGSDALAREAVVHLLGDAAMRDAVDLYVMRQPGFELVRSVLWLLRPWSAMQRCHEIFASAADLDARRSGIELLRVVADRRVLPWIPRYLDDPDPGIRSFGIGVVDQLLFAQLIDLEEAAAALAIARAHGDPRLLEEATRIVADHEATGSES